MPSFPLGEWLPDLGAVDLPGLVEVKNLYPTADGYRSFPAPSVVDGTTALSGSVRGANRGRLQDGTSFVAAGTEDMLYLDVSGLGFVADAGAFTVPADGRFIFHQYGQLVLATNGNDPPQVATLPGPWSFGDLSADASVGRCAAVAEDFYILGDITGRGTNAGIGQIEGGIHWSAAGDPTSWPTVGTQAARDALSDFQPLEGDGGRVMAIVPTEEYIAVFRERQTWRMDFVGLPNIFRFRLMDARRGCIVRDGAVAVGNQVYFPSEVGFLRFDGASVVPVGHQRVDRTWNRTLLRGALHRVSAVHAPDFRMVFWAIPTSTGDLFSEIWGYQYELDRWMRLSESGEWVLTILDTSSVGSLDGDEFGDEDMDDPGGLGDTDLDTLGSAGAANSDEVFGMFTPDHELATFVEGTGSVKSGEIVTGDFHGPEDSRVSLRSIRPHVFGSGFMFDLQVHARIKSDFPVNFAGPKIRSLNDLGDIPYRTKGRYLRARFTTAGDVEKFQGFEAVWQPGAGR